jgi:TPR repeat protein
MVASGRPNTIATAEGDLVIRRWVSSLGGGVMALLMVAMAITGNQAYTDHGLRWAWAAAAVVVAGLSIWFGRLVTSRPRVLWAGSDTHHRPPLLGQATLVALGVHSSRFDAAGPSPYLARDCDPDVVAALRGSQRLIVVHGARLAGASRSLAQAAIQHLAAHWLLVPPADPDLTLTDVVAAAAEWARRSPGAVLWLDALGTAKVAQLDTALLSTVPAGLRVCVTSETATITGIQVPASISAALRQYGQLVQVGPLSDAERTAMKEAPVYAWLHSVLDEPTPLLLGRLMVSLDQIMAALREIADDAPARLALVRVVTDWARIGMPGRLDRITLRRLYEPCWRELTDTSSATAVSKTGFVRTLRWATRNAWLRPQLVDEVIGGHLRPHSLLTVLAASETEGWNVSETLWAYADRALQGTDRETVALYAYSRGDHVHAIKLLSDADPANIAPDDMDTLATTFFGIAHWLDRSGDHSNARRWWKKVIATGHADWAAKAMVNLGSLERVQGEIDKARRWFIEAQTADHVDATPGAMVNLGSLEMSQGHVDQARHWYIQAVATDHPDAAPKAMFGLGLLEKNDVAKARDWYARAAITGHSDAGPQAMNNLGVLEEHEDICLSLSWYTQAAATDHPDAAPRAMKNLGRLADEQGDVEQARHWYTHAAGPNHPDVNAEAMSRLGALEARQRNFNEARRWWIEVVETGHVNYAPPAMCQLGVLEYDVGGWASGRRDPSEARRWWIRAAASGHPDAAPQAMNNLGSLEYMELAIPQARHWFTKAIATGHPDTAPMAMNNLAVLLEESRGDLAQTRYWLVQAAQTGHTTQAPVAMEKLGHIELSLGNADEARSWLTQAAASGTEPLSARAAVTLANFEHRLGRLDQARHWYEQAAASSYAGIAREAAKGLARCA